MSDWLEKQLTRGLAPVAAPEILRVRLGFAPSKRREFPRALLAVAAAVVLVIGGAYAASRTDALDLRREAGLDVAAEGAPVRCDRGSGLPLRVTAPKATVLLAHAGSAGEIPGRAPSATTEAGCHLCHAL